MILNIVTRFNWIFLKFDKIFKIPVLKFIVPSAIDLFDNYNNSKGLHLLHQYILFNMILNQDI